MSFYFNSLLSLIDLHWDTSIVRMKVSLLTAVLYNEICFRQPKMGLPFIHASG